jgi:hypothetical protein
VEVVVEECTRLDGGMSLGSWMRSTFNYRQKLRPISAEQDWDAAKRKLSTLSSEKYAKLSVDVLEHISMQHSDL